MSILQFPAAPRSSRSRPSDLRAVYLLDRDRDLGRLLTPSRATLARRTLRAPVLSVDRGPWTPDAATAETALLILDGLLVRDVVIADDVAAEILGPGDFIPASTDGDGTLPCGVRWTAMTPTQIACLDGGFAKAMLAFREIALALIEHQKVRADRLVTLRAIAHLNGVDRRLLALLWLLADRWGRMTRDGVILPMALRHSIMANLVGARRPTVSTAMSRLQRRDAIRQRPAGGWILREHPEGICSEVLTQAPQPRGPVFFPEKPASPAAADGDVDRRMRKLEDRANTARADSARYIQQLQSTCAAVESSRRQRPRPHGGGVPADDAAHSPGTPHDGAGSLHLIHLAAGCLGSSRR
jgi:CRP/FNR family cyclic AMP-dependent transcriptional regulator